MDILRLLRWCATSFMYRRVIKAISEKIADEDATVVLVDRHCTKLAACLQRFNPNIKKINRGLGVPVTTPVVVLLSETQDIPSLRSPINLPGVTKVILCSFYGESRTHFGPVPYNTPELVTVCLLRSK